MIDTDKYERILKATYSTDSIRCDTLLAHGLALLTEVKELREQNTLLTSQVRLAYEWVEAFHNGGTMISFIEHVYGDEEE